MDALTIISCEIEEAVAINKSKSITPVNVKHVYLLIAESKNTPFNFHVE